MNKHFKALLVDDEELARQDLKDVLSEFEQVKVVAEAENIEQARAQLKKYKPDVVFLDIQLPGENGFDLLENIPKNTHLIFVTAFDQYAIRAFEVNAQDYLLKPVSRERLTNALHRLETDTEQSQTSIRKLSADDSIFLRKNEGYTFLKISKILCIEARDDYSEIFMENDEKNLVHKSMKEWENRLPEQSFCRIHRSTIINIEKVIKIDDWYNHSHLVTLEGLEKPLVMSRRYFALVKNKLG